MCRFGPLTEGVPVLCNKRNSARNKVRRRQSHSNPPKETMKTHLLLAVAGLAIGDSVLKVQQKERSWSRVVDCAQSDSVAHEGSHATSVATHEEPVLPPSKHK